MIVASVRQSAYTTNFLIVELYRPQASLSLRYSSSI